MKGAEEFFVNEDLTDAVAALGDIFTEGLVEFDLLDVDHTTVAAEVTDCRPGVRLNGLDCHLEQGWGHQDVSDDERMHDVTNSW